MKKNRILCAFLSVALMAIPVASWSQMEVGDPSAAENSQTQRAESPQLNDEELLKVQPKLEKPVRKSLQQNIQFIEEAMED